MRRPKNAQELTEAQRLEQQKKIDQENLALLQELEKADLDKFVYVYSYFRFLIARHCAFGESRFVCGDRREI